MIDDALSGEAGLAGVQWLLYGAPAHQALQETIATLLMPPFVLWEWRLLRAKVKPGRKLTAYYEVDLREVTGRSRRQRSIAVTWTAPQGTQSISRETPPATVMEAEAVTAGVAPPFRRLLAVHDQWRMQVEVAPLDPAFPQLVRAMTPTHVATLLTAQGISVNSCRITTLRYRPRQRHVLRYDPLAADGQPLRPVFAKLSREAEGEVTGQIVQWAAAQLAQGNSGVTALCPDDWIAADRLLLYPFAAGAPLSQALHTNQPVLPLLQRAGMALRSLHDASAPSTLPLARKTFDSEVKATLQAGEHLAALAPALHTALTNLLEEAYERYQQLPAVEPVFTHSDFKADHLLTDGNRLTLIDFDSAALTDPAADLGKFLADLHWWQALDRRFDRQPPVAALLTGYGPTTDRAFYRRTQLYSALTLVKNTVRRLNLFDTTWLTQSQTLLTRAVALLPDI